MMQTERTSPRQLEDLHRRFRSARGLARDEKWAQAAATVLILDDVAESAVVDQLEQLLGTLRASEEPIEELYGPARRWAEEQLPRLREEGTVTPEIARPRNFREAAVITLIGTSGFSVLLLVVVLVAGTATISLLPLVTPPTLALAIVLLQALFAAVLRRRPFVVAVGITAVALGALSTAAGWSLVTLADQATRSLSVWWHLPIAGIAGLLAWGLDRATDRATSVRGDATPPESAAADAPLDDDQWLDQAAEALRMRGDISDRRIRRLLAEARTHADDADASLVEEFGSPQDYARRHRPQAGLRARRRAWWMAGVALVATVPLVDDLVTEGISWRADSMMRAALVAFLALAAVLAWRTSRREQQATRTA
ncbi:hypothetical protein [Nesterenkonia sp. F]|uniref:hypothetical protein n=1 Tax=Nesterenkonia sp. F TaxID=795955 RepID=UPI000255C942|nr:hypothetical protein [Nesterenkonia sp. F]